MVSVVILAQGVAGGRANGQAPGGAAEKARLTVKDAAVMFGARENILNASLSPDGTKIALLGTNGNKGAVLNIIDLASSTPSPVPILTSSGEPERLAWCRWAGNTRILCYAYANSVINTGDVLTVNRILAINVDGKNLQVLRTPEHNGLALGYTNYGGSVLDWNTGVDGHVLMVRRYVPEQTTGSLTAQTKEGFGVDDINSANLHSAGIERPRASAVEYISDGIGHVRIVGSDTGLNQDGYNNGRVVYQYRTKPGGEWQPLPNPKFDPYYVDPTLNVAYGLKSQDGRNVAYSLALDGSGKETMLFAHPTVDVDDFATIGRNSRVIGVIYTTDRSNVEYFDPAMRRLASALAKAIPALPLIRIVDSSQDERKLLISASSDTDPGRLYLLNRDTSAMTEVTPTRPAMEHVALAPMKPVSFPARDGTMIPAYLTLPPGSDGKNLPGIVLPHGGPGARDAWGFDWLPQFWAQIGYAVIQPNFRGSTGYGDAWFQNNGFRSWRAAIGDVTDAGHWLVKEGIADPKKLAIFGWSYGGYAALQSAVVEPDLFKAVVAVAPVTDLAQFKEDAANFTHYRVMKDFIGSGPHILEGSPARQAGKIKAPVLMFSGTYDANVSVGQARLMADRLRDAGHPGQLVIYDKLDHYLDDSAARSDLLSKSAAFVEQAFAAGK
ncbi:S9 family peptidase [Sphingobium sp. H33]|uniref:S9 family peptidase n=2 Tax=Sphingobium nicotianae TaxID=2782607 RepID=A0A9X1DDJ5_9SPHN|nr:S9 family peptidase [Sphingobium nicotianae]